MDRCLIQFLSQLGSSRCNGCVEDQKLNALQIPYGMGMPLTILVILWDEKRTKQKSAKEPEQSRECL